MAVIYMLSAAWVMLARKRRIAGWIATACRCGAVASMLVVCGLAVLQIAINCPYWICSASVLSLLVVGCVFDGQGSRVSYQSF
ncbi:hypothetical protein LOC68_03715 [Blastopirellula sp. JC732]|uniref:Uncharacterized protein n=1 Tax=Blastopirellula sediminis TaxID=2894196 RepID=A0A9X1SEQ6_9BACT|nr:hypothetical protein [Blastopirellula sediminis]MCC9607714.1 hypothetical protein [Blastopirellula sediminis]MCC9627493.1 hypothetical protein [Blastopirellula sediminis]